MNVQQPHFARTLVVPPERKNDPAAQQALRENREALNALPEDVRLFCATHPPTLAYPHGFAVDVARRVKGGWFGIPNQWEHLRRFRPKPDETMSDCVKRAIEAFLQDCEKAAILAGMHGCCG